MTRTKSAVAPSLVVALALATLACGREVQGKGPESAATSMPATPVPTTAGTNLPESSRTPASAAPQTVLASQEYNGDPDLRCDVLEVKRVSGGALLVKWRLIHVPAAAATGLVAQESKKICHNWSWEGAYVTEPVENKKYLGLHDSNGAWIGQGPDKCYAPGERQGMWMKFPAPPETSTRITFVFPGFAPFEDLPVAP
jgi:hypothetical protein